LSKHFLDNNPFQNLTSSNACWIKNNYVRHENSSDFCQLCQRLTELKSRVHTSLSGEEVSELVELEEHYRKKRVQWRTYHSLMSQLVRYPGARIIVQDFNKQETNSIEMQVLTIVLYEASTGSVERHYFHYFLPPGISNDMLAVIACHRIFFNEPLIKNATRLSFWNDGGPKHFKLTANLAHMCSFASTRQNPASVSLNFFPSYHGSGPADAAASHIKNCIRNTTRNFHWMEKSIHDFVSMLGDNLDPMHTTCTEVVIPPDISKILICTAHGTKALHRFTFSPGTWVSGWVDSASMAPVWVKQLQLQPGTGPLL